MARTLHDIGVEVASVPKEPPPMDLSAYLPGQIGIGALLTGALVIWGVYMLFALVRMSRAS